MIGSCPNADTNLQERPPAKDQLSSHHVDTEILPAVVASQESAKDAVSGTVQPSPQESVLALQLEAPISAGPFPLEETSTPLDILMKIQLVK